MIDEKIVIEELCSKFRKISEDEIEGAEDLEWNRCITMAIAEINSQPQVQPIVRTTEEVVEMLNKISCTDCDKNSSHCHFSETECKNYWYEWLTKKEV